MDALMTCGKVIIFPFCLGLCFGDALQMKGEDVSKLYSCIRLLRELFVPV